MLILSGGSGNATITVDASNAINTASSTAGLAIPIGTTAQRPANPAAGTMRYNTTIADIEIYANSTWAALNNTPPPVNVVAPAIAAANTVVGTTINVSTGTWTNSPTSYTYQWLANSAAISSNATANTFTITSTQLNANLSCNVTAVNLAGGTTATSNTAGPVSLLYTVSYLSVAGGGGGGFDQGGGGGAGGLLTNSLTFTGNQVYTVTVGAGGGVTANGGNSSISGSGISTVLSYGGGAGQPYSAGNNGGSGGGGGIPGNVSQPGGSGVSGQGYGGGSGNSDGSTFSCGGGGGGAGGGGGTGPGAGGGSGVASSITGSSVTYAGGGGCGSNVYPGGGGSGGGGSGNSGSGSANTGGGGGGGTGGSAGTGGSGVVILSIPTASYSGVKTGSPTVTTSGSNTILKYTSSGSYTA